MPIPVSNSTDLLLSTLLRKQVHNFDEWIDLKDLVQSFPDSDRHLWKSAADLPVTVLNDVLFLQHNSLVEFRPENPHIRLTPMGVFSALLFDVS